MADNFTTDQKVDESVYDKRGMRFSAMLTSDYKNNRFLNRWIVLILVRDLEQRDVKVAI